MEKRDDGTDDDSKQDLDVALEIIGNLTRELKAQIADRKKLREELEIMTRSRDAWQETAARATQNYADATDQLERLRT